jgi:hypothetical protein
LMKEKMLSFPGLAGNKAIGAAWRLQR